MTWGKREMWAGVGVAEVAKSPVNVVTAIVWSGFHNERKYNPMVCINRRSSGMNVWLSAYNDCDIPPQVAHPIHDDVPTEYFEYDGRDFDPNDTLYLPQFRHYDPTEGCWLSEDPVGYEPGDDATFRYSDNARQ